MLKKILAIIAALGSALSAIFFVLFRQAKEEQKETEQKNKDLINNMDALQYSEHIKNEVKKQNEELVERLTVITLLIVLMLSMNSCQSNKTKTEYKTIYAVPELYFPQYPAPKNNVIPYDKDFKKVTDVNTEIEYVVMPFWYYKLIVDYKVNVDEQKTKYEAFKERLN